MNGRLAFPLEELARVLAVSGAICLGDGIDSEKLALSSSYKFHEEAWAFGVENVGALGVVPYVEEEEFFRHAARLSEGRGEGKAR